MSNTAKWVIGIVVFVLAMGGLFVITMISLVFSDVEDESAGTTGERVAVVELTEPIIESQDIVRQFKKYRENRSVRAIVFRVDSPGGGVSASQEIYEEVRKTRQSGKPVVVSMGSVAASGGYYVSCRGLLRLLRGDKDRSQSRDAHWKYRRHLPIPALQRADEQNRH
jgi:membrane-bound ClpP family serine protease